MKTKIVTILIVICITILFTGCTDIEPQLPTKENEYIIFKELPIWNWTLTMTEVKSLSNPYDININFTVSASRMEIKLADTVDLSPYNNLSFRFENVWDGGDDDKVEVLFAFYAANNTHTVHLVNAYVNEEDDSNSYKIPFEELFASSPYMDDMDITLWDEIWIDCYDLVRGSFDMIGLRFTE